MRGQGALVLLLVAGLIGGAVFYAQHRDSRPPEPVTPIPGPVSQGSPPLGVVLTSVLSVRAGAGAEFGSLGTLQCGDVVVLEAQEGSWYRLRVNDLVGYAHNAYVVPIGPGGLQPNCQFLTESKAGRQEPAPDTTLPNAPTRSSRPVVQARRIAPEGRDIVEDRPVRAVRSVPVSAPARKKTSRPPAAGDGPSNLTLSTRAAAKAVPFPHKVHQGLAECSKCHHPLDTASDSSRDKACRTCHLPGGQTGRSQSTNKEAFHGTCVNCHRAQNAGPTGCVDCHGSG